MRVARRACLAEDEYDLVRRCAEGLDWGDKNEAVWRGYIDLARWPFVQEFWSELLWAFEQVRSGAPDPELFEAAVSLLREAVSISDRERADGPDPWQLSFTEVTI